ncbi:hypothetical protein NC651_002425 [Populus alba x Populus x berolinensis]|nr:hypothetical protein NC651_002425 [Populus alba x Populus x berolinensis]
MGQSPPSPVLHDRASPFNIVDRSTSQWSSFSFPNTGSPPDVILNKLSFKDRQISRGTIIVPYRLLCKQANESRNHTFFDCHFAKEKWIDVLSTSTLEDVIKSFGGLNKSDWIVLSFQVVCPAFVLLGWNKNAVLYNNQRCSPSSIVLSVRNKFHNFPLRKVAVRQLILL